MAKATCHHCKDRFDRETLTTAGRKVGGNYRRASSFKDCLICEHCLRRLASSLQQGQLSVSQWSGHGLRRALERLDARQAAPVEATTVSI